MLVALTSLSPALSLRGLAMLASLTGPAAFTAPAAVVAGFIVWLAAFACRFDAYCEALRRLDDAGTPAVRPHLFPNGSFINATNGRGRHGWRR